MKELSNGKDMKLQPLTLRSEPDGTSCFSRITLPPEEDYSVNNLDIIFTVISIVFRIVSIVLNVWLAVDYFRHNQWNYFVWTTCCIVIPMVITTLLCIHIYMYDHKRSNSKNCLKFLWFVILCPFLFRYYKSLQYAVISKIAEKKNDVAKQKLYYKYMIEEDSDVALIRIFESSLEAAPQKILQISIYLAADDPMRWNQFLTICGCFASLTWCIVVYHKYNRYTQPDKEKISVIGMIFQIIWHFCIYVSRILCIAIVASVFPVWTITACALHAFLICIIILFYERPTFCSNTIFHRVMFAMTIGIVFIFTYISLKDVRTRYRYALYYILCVIENFACVILFSTNANQDSQKSSYFLPLCIVSFFSFFIGIFFMIFYYTRFHPNVIARNLETNANSILRIG